jgi:alkylhydroperoxidase/carboxymuconolactone decarboxylase family protein YurZ
MTEDLKSMSTRRKEAHAELLARDSAVYRAFLEMEQAAFADGVLPKRSRNSSRSGSPWSSTASSCMQWHIEQAAAAGATEREVLEAIEVGIEMGGGFATAHARFALGVMTSVFGRRPAMRTIWRAALRRRRRGTTTCLMGTHGDT